MHLYKTSATLLSDYNVKEPLSDCLEVADVMQSVRNYLTDVLLRRRRGTLIRAILFRKETGMSERQVSSWTGQSSSIPQ